MDEGQQTDAPEPFVAMSGLQLAQVIIIGACLGLAVWLLTYLLGTYVIKAIACHSTIATKECASVNQYAEGVADILAAGGALFIFVKQQIFRPLLAILAATISLWGLLQVATQFSWFILMFVSIALYAIAYGIFVWLARIRVFWIALLLTTVLVVVIRLILSS